MCPGLYHFSGPVYAVSSSCLCVGLEWRLSQERERLGTERVSIMLVHRLPGFLEGKEYRSREATCCAGKSTVPEATSVFLTSCPDLLFRASVYTFYEIRHFSLMDIQWLHVEGH